MQQQGVGAAASSSISDEKDHPDYTKFKMPASGDKKGKTSNRKVDHAVDSDPMVAKSPPRKTKLIPKKPVLEPIQPDTIPAAAQAAPTPNLPVFNFAPTHVNISLPLPINTASTLTAPPPLNTASTHPGSSSLDYLSTLASFMSHAPTVLHNRVSVGTMTSASTAASSVMPDSEVSSGAPTASSGLLSGLDATTAPATPAPVLSYGQALNTGYHNTLSSYYPSLVASSSVNHNHRHHVPGLLSGAAASVLQLRQERERLDAAILGMVMNPSRGGGVAAAGVQGVASSGGATTAPGTAELTRDLLAKLYGGDSH